VEFGEVAAFGGGDGNVVEEALKTAGVSFSHRYPRLKPLHLCNRADAQRNKPVPKSSSADGGV